MVLVFYRSFRPEKLISASLQVKKSIIKTICKLILATRKISPKNLIQLVLFITEKAITTISKVSSVVPSIFYASTFVNLMRKPSSVAKVGWMALTSLLESRSVDTNTDFFRKMIGYRMQETCARFSRWSL